MVLNRITGGLTAAASFILFGLLMLARGSSPAGIEIMDRLGITFALLFIGAQIAVCLLFLKPSELLVPLLLFAGGTILYAVLIGSGSGAAEAGRIPLHHALFAGASFSGMASGVLVMTGESGS